MDAVFGLQLAERTTLAVTAPEGTLNARLAYAVRGDGGEPAWVTIEARRTEGTNARGVGWLVVLAPGDLLVRIAAVEPPLLLVFEPTVVLIAPASTTAIATWSAQSGKINDPKNPWPPPSVVTSPPELGAIASGWFRTHLLRAAASALPVGAKAL